MKIFHISADVNLSVLLLCALFGTTGVKEVVCKMISEGCSCTANIKGSYGVRHY